MSRLVVPGGRRAVKQKCNRPARLDMLEPPLPWEAVQRLFLLHTYCEAFWQRGKVNERSPTSKGLSQ